MSQDYKYSDADKTVYPLYDFNNKLPIHVDWIGTRVGVSTAINLVYPNINFISFRAGFGDSDYVDLNFTASYDPVFTAQGSGDSFHSTTPSFFVLVGFEDSVSCTSFKGTSHTYKFNLGTSAMMGDFFIIAIPKFADYL